MGAQHSKTGNAVPNTARDFQVQDFKHMKENERKPGIKPVTLPRVTFLLILI